MVLSNHLICQMLGVTLPCPNLTGTTIIIIPIYSVLARVLEKYAPELLKILNKYGAKRFKALCFPIYNNQDLFSQI